MTAAGQRALRRLGLSPAQARAAALALHDDLRRLEAARDELACCRLELRRTLARPARDLPAVLELATQERLLERLERELAATLEGRLSRLPRPEQAARLRALPPAVLGGSSPGSTPEGVVRGGEDGQSARSTVAPRPPSLSTSRA